MLVNEIKKTKNALKRTTKGTQLEEDNEDNEDEEGTEEADVEQRNTNTKVKIIVRGGSLVEIHF